VGPHPADVTQPGDSGQAGGDRAGDAGRPAVGEDDAAVPRLVAVHADGEGGLDLGGGPGDVQHGAAVVGAGDGQPLRPRPVGDGLVVLLGRAEPLGEFFRSEELAAEGVAGHVLAAQQVVQGGLVAERQGQREADRGGGGQAAQGARPAQGGRLGRVEGERDARLGGPRRAERGQRQGQQQRGLQGRLQGRGPQFMGEVHGKQAP